MSDTDEETLAAATKIQAIQRGREDRAKVAQMKQDKQRENAAATAIQARQRGREDRARVKALREEKARATNANAEADANAQDTPTAGDNEEGVEKKTKKKKKRRRRKRMGVLIVGPPGVGKSEQAARIADRYEALTLGPIDNVLSWAVAEGKESAGAITEAREGGTAVPAEVVALALGERLGCPDIKDAVAWTVEGFPSESGELDELIRLAGGKSPARFIIAMNSDVEVLMERIGESGTDDKPDADAVEAAAGACTASISGIQAAVEGTKVKFKNIDDASGDADEIFQELCEFLGASAKEDEAAEKIQAQVRGREARAKIKEQDAAAVKIQAQIRGKEARIHAQSRKDIKAAHDEDEILSSLTSAAAGPDGKRIQNCFPRKRTKDVEITQLMKKLARIKSKEDTIKSLQTLLDRPKVTELLHRDFKRKNKKGVAVINYEEFESMVTAHGGKMEERIEKLTSEMEVALQREFEIRPGAFRELFDDIDVDDSGGVDLDEFRDAFADRAELWGYAKAFSADRTKDMGLFEAIDADNDNIISWDEFEAYFLAEKNKREMTRAKEAALVQQTARAVDREKDLEAAAEHREKLDDYATDEECELEDLRKMSQQNQAGATSTARERRNRNPKVASNRARGGPPQAVGGRARGGKDRRGRAAASTSAQRAPAAVATGRYQPSAPEESSESERPPMGTPDRKIMLVKILRKYRRGLHTAFEFYCKANIGSVKQFTFDQMREEHGGVNLLMFRRMCKDFSLTHDPRAKFNPKSKAVEEMIRPYITKEEIDAIFRRHAQHLKRVSSISHGKGILNEAQFAAAFAQIAVVLLREEPWCERYPEEWRRVDAIFARLDVNNNVLLRKRLRGFGGFSKGDGDIGSRAGGKPTVVKCRGFSFNLRLPGDPVTPPPESTRPKFGNRMREQKDIREMQAAENEDATALVSGSFGLAARENSVYFFFGFFFIFLPVGPYPHHHHHTYHHHTTLITLRC
jgi:adenylate kinase family enzyme